MIHLARHAVEKIKRKGFFHLVGKCFYILHKEGVSGFAWRISRMAGKDERDSAPLLAQSGEEYYRSLAQNVQTWSVKPLISILLSLCDTPENRLCQTIDSVMDQVYGQWELCIAAAASAQPHVRRVLEEYRRRDARIKIAFRATDDPVSAADRALALAGGGYAALLGQDGLLERHALYRLAEAILADHPDVIYSDEAFIAEQSGEVIGHIHRPAFSPELLRAHCYIGHLAAFKTTLLRDLGGFKPGSGGSPDYDLVLRAAERAKVIVHIPEVLYRRCSHEGSSERGEVMETSKKALAAHLARCGEKAEVGDGRDCEFFDVRYALEADLRVAIIIPTKNHGDLVRQCVDSIERTCAGVQYDVVIVDHASDDPAALAYFAELRTRHKVLRYEGAFNFSVINNWAAAQLAPIYTHYLLCNNDIEAMAPGWLERMLELGQKRDVGIVGAKLYYPDRRTVQHAGVCVGMYGIAEHYGKFMEKGEGRGSPGYLGSLIANREMSAVTAACLLIRRDAFEWVAGFDEALAVGFGDVDLCLRVRQAGYRIVFCAQAELIHHESFTRGKHNQHPEDSSYFLNRWQSFINAGDPYYNPNLTLLNTLWHTKKPEEAGAETGKKNTRRVFRKTPDGLAHFQL